MPRVKFISYFDHVLKEEKTEMKIGTYNRHCSVLKKLKEYSPDLLFTDITETWIKKYRAYLSSKLDNKSTTIAANIASIKKILKLAAKAGIKLQLDLDDLKPGSTKGNTTFLNPKELERFSKYYFSEFIKESHQLTLGYFLFSCFSGLRISDVQCLNRNDILDGEVAFATIKTNTGQTIAMNKKAIAIVQHMPKLFVLKYADQTHNDTLKDISKFLGINKKITFHVSRHTFATNFLRVGGKVEYLQKLLGHKKIETTMVYVHILADEANKEIFRLDDLF
jgi:site-specific recombinase XerD